MMGSIIPTVSPMVVLFFLHLESELHILNSYSHQTGSILKTIIDLQNFQQTPVGLEH
jgi:hypothetical protein